MFVRDLLYVRSSANGCQHVLVVFRSVATIQHGRPRRQTDASDTEDLAAALAFALRFQGASASTTPMRSWREFVAKRLVEHLA
jgi:hypothetical protein